MRKRKSIAFYIVCFCFTLIFGSSLFAMIWQPGFEQGIISIRMMDSYVGYHLWGFLASVLLLLAFVYSFAKTLYSPAKRKIAFASGLAAGVIFIFLLDHITYGWTSYTPLSALGASRLTVEKYNTILICIQGIIAIALTFLVFRWYKHKNHAAT